MATNNLPAVRLVEIERAAEQARQTVGEQLAEYGLAFDRDTDLRHAATVLTGGPVDAEPNLTADGERLAGMLVWSDHGTAILFEAYDPPVRQRFSIAHELGHFCLHASGSQRVHRRCQAGSVNPDEIGPPEPSSAPPVGVGRPGAANVVDIEAEADAFAGAFLLPRGDFQEALSRFGPCDAFLARLFQVSEATFRRRTRDLALIAAQAGEAWPRREVAP